MTKTTKIIISLVFVLTLLCAAAFSASAAGNPFGDVPDDAYYHDAVLWAYENGVTTGTTATKFAPASTCTRGQVVTFLWRAFGQPVPTSLNTFSDVKPGDYYYSAVLWACENGITNGTSSTAFSPDRTCSVAHIVTFIYRAFGEPGKTGEGEWYSDAINWAKSSGLIEGTESDKAETATLNQSDCPRSDVVTILYRYRGEGSLTIYVAPDGSDETGDGTINNPFATIMAARDAVRQLDKSQYTGITVFLSKGEYQLSEPVYLTEEDSGTETCPIKYIGEKGTSVIGGIKLTAADFTKSEGGLTEYFPESVRDQMVMVDLKPYGITAEAIKKAQAGYGYLTTIPFLSLNGERQMIAQYPNDFLHVGETVTHSADGTTDTAIDHVTLQTVDYGEEHAAFVQSWSEVLPVFVRARLMKLWCPDDTKVAEIYKDESKIDIYFSGGHEPEVGTILYFYNVPEAIDIPGEYIIDEDAILYYYPAEGFEDGLLTLPLAESLFNIKDADCITLANINFTSAGNGLVVEADNFSLLNSTVSSIRNIGIRLTGDAALLENNTIFNIGSDGIDMTSGDIATITGGKSFVYNNDVYECSVTDAYGYCITVDGVEILVSHNDAHDSNFKGIHTGNSVNTTVEYNDVWRQLLLCDDVGAVSGDGTENANVVFRYNYIHEIAPEGEAAKINDYNPDYSYFGAYALYFDGGCSFIECYGNVINDCDTGYLSNGGYGNSLHNNLFMNCHDWYVVFSEYFYHPENGLSKTRFPDFIYTDVWKAVNPKASQRIADPSTTTDDDPLLWCAPSDNVCYGNYIVYNKAERNFTNWGVRPYNIEPAVQKFSSETINTDTTGMTTYTSKRVSMTIEEAIEASWNAGYEIIELEQFATIGRVN